MTLLLVLGTSWLLLWAVRPDSTLASPEVFWWYFLVTASTVGYGDFFPETLAGRLVGIYIIVGGVVTITLVFARVSDLLENARGRRMHGRTDHDLRDHGVLIGYTPGRTERLAAAHTVLVDARDDNEAVVLRSPPARPLRRCTRSSRCARRDVSTPSPLSTPGPPAWRGARWR